MNPSPWGSETSFCLFNSDMAPNATGIRSVDHARIMVKTNLFSNFMSIVLFSGIGPKCL